jgi:hypothetical protein
MDELRTRTKQFALRVIALVEDLPANTVGRTIGNQLVRSGTSVGANYRAAGRAKSRADFIEEVRSVELGMWSINHFVFTPPSPLLTWAGRGR